MKGKLLLTVCAAAVAATGFSQGGNVLVWSTGNSGGSTASVASALMGTGAFTSVTALNQDTGVGLSTLTNYDRVLFFTNSGGSPSNGDVLADFADTGRRLVVATFAWANQGDNTIGGRFVSGGYSPFDMVGSSLYSGVTIASTDGSPYWLDVNAISGYFHDNVVGAAGAVVHGTWTDGTPLLASKANIAGVNLFPDYTWGNVSGDYVPLFRNALVAVPEPTTMAALGLGAAALLRRRRK